MCLNYLSVNSLKFLSHIWADNRLFELYASRFVPLCLEFCLYDLLANLFIVSYCFRHIEQFNSERIEHLLNLLLMRQRDTGFYLRQDGLLIGGQHSVLDLVQDFASSLYYLVLECDKLCVSFS